MSSNLARDLASTDPEVRRLAAQSLANDEGDQAPVLIARALADTDWRVRKEAALSAANAPRRTDVLRELLSALGDRDDVGFRNSAVEALVAIGPDAVPTAIAALRTLDADGRKLAVEVLGGLPDARGAEALATALEDADPNVRQAAAEALGTSAMGGDDARKIAVRALRGVLTRGEPMMKLAVLGALSRIGVAHEWRVLEPLMNDPVLRGAILLASAKCSDPAAGLALADALFDPNTAHQRAALAALADWIHAATEKALPVDDVAARLQARDAGAQVRALAEADASSRGAALMVLALLGDAEAAPEIVRALLDPMLARSAETAVALLGAATLPALLAVGEREPPSRHAALLLVVPTLTSRLDDRALTVVRATLGHDSDDVAAAAAQVLGALGAGEDIDRLAVLASSDSENVHGRAARSAALAIEQLAQRHPNDALAAFARLADDPAKTVAGCVLLAALQGKPPASIDYLKRALGAGDARERRAAIEAFAAIGGDESRETVATALADEDRDVQLAAVRALGMLRHPVALSTLIDSLSDPEIVAAAASALSEADGERALEVCSRLVMREDPAIASAAVAALGKLGERAEPGLARALDHASDEVVKLALSELGRVPSARALEHVGHSLDHASWEVRRLAAEVLGAEGSDEAYALLRARLERENDAAVREAIMTSLAGPFASFGGSEGA
jgi:HEAT repeat protein